MGDDIAALSNVTLYLAVKAVVADKRCERKRSLEEFLRALRLAFRAHEHLPDLPPETFIAVIAAAFTLPITDETHDWADMDLAVDDDGPATADTIDRILRSQILDMQDAAATGLLDDDYRSFGKLVERSGSGVRATDSCWYNWTPAEFLECGMAGAFDGWSVEDEGRIVVRGDVAVIDPDGHLATVPATELEPGTFPITAITWKDVDRFLWAGQNYE